MVVPSQQSQRAADGKGHPDLLFVSHADCSKLLTVKDTMRI